MVPYIRRPSHNLLEVADVAWRPGHASRARAVARPLPPLTGLKQAAASAGSPRRRGAPVVLLLDRGRQFLLGHRGPPGHAQPAGQPEQVFLAGVGVHPAVAFLRLAARPGRLLVRRPLGAARLGLPVVPNLLEAVLECSERGPVGALTFAVLLDRAVVRLDPRLLGLGRRALQRRRQFLTSWQGSPSAWAAARAGLQQACGPGR